MIIAEPELNTILIENNYLDVSTQEIKTSYFAGPHSQSRKSGNKSKRVKKVDNDPSSLI